MSIFFMRSIAVMTRWDFAGSGSMSSSTSTRGTICQETPYLSLSQPHCWAFGSPPADSFVQKWSTSAWVSQLTCSEMASLNLKNGPPLSAVNVCPSSSKATVITDPAGLPWISFPASPYRDTVTTFEFLKIAV